MDEGRGSVRGVDAVVVVAVLVGVVVTRAGKVLRDSGSAGKSYKVVTQLRFVANIRRQKTG